MAVVRCVTMQKNESRLLEAWIKYYGYMFGFENLYILDNGSEHTDVRDCLNKYQKSGVNVIFDYDKKDDFENKGEIIKNIATEWDLNGEQYDFLLPIDCDEFVFFCDGEYFSVVRNKIHNYLDSLKGSKDAFLIQHDFINDPKCPGLFYPTVVPKSLFVKGNIGEIDHGFHHPKPLFSDGEVKKSKLGYFHFHNKPFSDVLYHAKEKLEKFVNVNDKEALEKYTGNGHHLVRYFFISENEYINMYENKPKVLVEGLVALLTNISIDLPSLFGGMPTTYTRKNPRGYILIWDKDEVKNYISYIDTRFYLTAHPDFEGIDIDPLAHFAEFGFREGRKLNREPVEDALKTELWLEEKSEEKSRYLSVLSSNILSEK